MRARVRPPLWAEVLYFALAAFLLAWVMRHLPPAHHAGAHDLPDVQLGFFALIVGVFEAIWAGIQAFSSITLAALAATVNMLWAGLSRLGSWALELGRDTVDGFRKAWSFVRALYDDVLKPAWQKFWKFVDWARHTLDHIFGPVIRFLRKVRGWLLQYYEKYVRPVLDTIDVARKVLQLFELFGVEWAKKLDAKLAAIENWISDKFLEVMSKVNEAIDIVDRVITADGLFQRLALVRSITRDFEVIQNEWARVHKKPMTDAEIAAAKKRKYFETPPDTYGGELGKFYAGTDSAYAGIIGELASEWSLASGINRSPSSQSPPL